VGFRDPWVDGRGGGGAGAMTWATTAIVQWVPSSARRATLSRTEACIKKPRGNGDGQPTNGPYGLPIWSIGQWGPQTLAESPGNRIQLAELAGLFSFEKSVPPNPVAGVVFLLRGIGYDNLDDDKI